MDDKAIGEFIGFINGFEARNLESIRKNVGVQINDMRTRLKIMSNSLDKSKEHQDLAESLTEVDQSFVDGDYNIVERLKLVGVKFSNSFNRFRDIYVQQSKLADQTKGFIRSFVIAAESCNEPKVTEIAINLGTDFHNSLRAPSS